jgi:hypothetical protein
MNDIEELAGYWEEIKEPREISDLSEDCREYLCRVFECEEYELKNRRITIENLLETVTNWVDVEIFKRTDSTAFHGILRVEVSLEIGGPGIYLNIQDFHPVEIRGAWGGSRVIAEYYGIAEKMLKEDFLDYCHEISL